MKQVVLILMVVWSALGWTQNTGPFSVGLQYKNGFLSAHRETMHHLVQSRNNVLEVDFNRQDTSGTAYSDIYRYPTQGASLILHDYGYRPVLGVSFTFSRVTKFPIYQSERWGFFDFRLGQGVSYITEKYDAFENKKNIAIGSHINGFVNLQFSWEKHFEHFYFGAGLDFSHISNARLKTPNQGLNTLTAFASAGYNISPRKVYDKPKFDGELSDVRKFNKWHFHFIFGLKQNLPDHFEARNFGVAALQGLYRKNVSLLWDFEAGIDLVYNEANRWYYETNPVPAYQALLVGGYSGMSLSLYRSQIYFGLGVYALNIINPEGWVYNRAGIRLLSNEKWNFSIGIKAHVGVADYLEWGLGYRL